MLYLCSLGSWHFYASSIIHCFDCCSWDFGWTHLVSFPWWSFWWFGIVFIFFSKAWNGFHELFIDECKTFDGLIFWDHCWCQVLKCFCHFLYKVLWLHDFMCSISKPFGVINWSSCSSLNSWYASLISSITKAWATPVFSYPPSLMDYMCLLQRLGTFLTLCI